MTPTTNKRIESLDLLKGLVIVIMALDHVRDYFHYASYFFSPNDVEQTSISIFFTRFITNFCAPAFSFLAGVSAFMVSKRKSDYELSAFLLKRGFWLVFVEIVIMNFGWHFDPNYKDAFLGVIWVLGISMVFLAGLIHLSKNSILFFSCILIFGHNLLDSIHFSDSTLWTILHERRTVLATKDHIFSVKYPLIPWIGVMSLGYYFGNFYDKSINPEKRKKLFNGIGIAALVLFIILRFYNLYGESSLWKEFDTISKSSFSFLNLTKYPPSLFYLLFTLGGVFLFLANSENLKGKVVDFFTVFGRVPFFFYILHIYFIHFFALIVAEITGYGWGKMILPDMPYKVDSLKGFGFNLPITYLIWILVIIVLYFFCKKFDSYKQANKSRWWLSYF
jgi:uncharacterized membrane protein